MSRRARTAVVLGLLAGALVLTAPRLADGIGIDTAAPWGEQCTVSTGSGEIALSVEEAQRATTAVVLQARGQSAPGVRDIDPVALELLAQGPRDGAGPVLTCRVDPDRDLARQEITASGLTPRAQQVRVAMAEVFGDQSLGGFAPGGVGDGHGADSTHYDGRAVDVFFRPVTEAHRRQGWLLAHWLVARAGDLDIQYVIFDDHYWSVRSPGRGWQDYEAPEPGGEVLRHLDHVHVDVLRGD